MARSTGNLCEAANQAVQGEASEEKLVTSAKQVASSTAQLLVACKVKADPNSENMKRLQVRGRNSFNILQPTSLYIPAAFHSLFLVHPTLNLIFRTIVGDYVSRFSNCCWCAVKLSLIHLCS